MPCGCGDENKNPSSVPYIVYESEQARNERNIKRLAAALIAAILLTFFSNAAWLYAWCQYDYSSEETTTTTTIELDGGDGGNANYIGNDGDITIGTDKGNENNDNAQP